MNKEHYTFPELKDFVSKLMIDFESDANQNDWEFLLKMIMKRSYTLKEKKRIVKLYEASQ